MELNTDKDVVLLEMPTSMAHGEQRFMTRQEPSPGGRGLRTSATEARKPGQPGAPNYDLAQLTQNCWQSTPTPHYTLERSQKNPRRSGLGL